VCRAVIGRRDALRSLLARTEGSRAACIDSVRSRFDLHNPLNSTGRITGNPEVTGLGKGCRPSRSDPAVQRPPEVWVVLLLKDGEVDRVSHRLIASVVWMEMIFGREAGQESAGVIRITQDRIEVDYPVKGAAGSDPFVD
jgi:hypothetical protein